MNNNPDARTRIRLVPEGAPQVYPAGDSVVMQCTTHQADVLARILAHYDVLTARSPADALRDETDEPRHAAPRIEVAEGYVAGVWRHALVEILSAAARISTRHIPTSPSSTTAASV